jgi:hypothetical protein
LPKELQSERRLSGTWHTSDKIETMGNQAASQNIVEARDARRRSLIGWIPLKFFHNCPRH